MPTIYPQTTCIEYELDFDLYTSGSVDEYFAGPGLILEEFGWEHLPEMDQWGEAFLLTSPDKMVGWSYERFLGVIYN